MTNERKNEIWAMLDAQSQEAMSRLWHNVSPKKDECKLLEILFGTHNLTAQAEEKPKEPRYKRGDKVVCYGQLAVVSNIHDLGYDVVFNGDYGDYKLFNLPESSLEPYTEPKEPLCSVDSKNYNNGNHIVGRENNIDYSKIQPESAESVESDMDAGHFDIVSFQYNLDYQQYRLDLAKEIAVKLIEINKISWVELGQDAVDLANEIVKRLKETDNENA